MIYSIGYQNGLTLEDLDKVMQAKEIDCLLDVRTTPYGRLYHFNRKALEKRYPQNYLYKGDELGGLKPIAPEYLKWLEQIETRAPGNYLLFCYEEEPRLCHRHYVLALHLLTRGIEVIHLDRHLNETRAGQIEPQLPLL